ncbi:hypothetical protein [Acidiluteibacter ferrifornacis]|uniref:DUF4595 domain-containing protein n=1 Tax=Acidiluteibacter ferrifornacis TaxID=2692424 RepID=A0A6N9NKD2_9FLAO|nr:hypothetical protein [Acidiluteibacter ferrifornacis]NBG67158.1 hypothetical protein [Acidiluteibacter ferrifornacis]
MKKTFGILFTICLLLFSCTKSADNTERKSDLSNYDFNGQIKSVKSELFNLIIEKDTFKIGEKINSLAFDRNSLLEFNELGNLTSIKEFLYNGKVIKEDIYTYDKNDLLIKRKEIDNYGKGSFLDFEFKYDSKDSLTSVLISSDGFKRTLKIERDSNNRPIKRETIQNDTVQLTYSVEYDQNDNLISESQFRYKNIPVKLIERSFNSKNLKEKEKIIEYRTWDTIRVENEYLYNNNNQLIVEKFNVENDSTFDEIKNKYHKNGKLKESIIVMGENEFAITERNLYNENGDLTQRTVKTNDGKTNDVWSYDFKYDSENNWIEKIEFKNNKPLRIVKRTIEYYK